MAVKTDVDALVTNLLDETVVLDENIVDAGMEDIIRKLELINPAMLKEFESDVAVTKETDSFDYFSPTFKLYCNGIEMVPHESTDHISNSYSLLNDSGETQYYIRVGNYITIYPYSASNSYIIRNVVYDVYDEYSNLAWPQRYIYPLGLYCAYITLFTKLHTELEDLIDDCDYSGITNDVTVGEVPLLTYINRVLARLNRDDVELAASELDLVRTMISAYTAEVQMDAVLSDKLKSRVEASKMLLSKALSLKQLYMEWFGQSQEEAK